MKDLDRRLIKIYVETFEVDTLPDKQNLYLSFWSTTQDDAMSCVLQLECDDRDALYNFEIRVAGTFELDETEKSLDDDALTEAGAKKLFPYALEFLTNAIKETKDVLPDFVDKTLDDFLKDAVTTDEE